jgi:hypothetical protein
MNDRFIVLNLVFAFTRRVGGGGTKRLRAIDGGNMKAGAIGAMVSG